MKIPERVEEIPGEGLLYELKNRIEWDYSYYISREKSTGGYWKRVSSIAQIPHHAISTYRTHPVEEPDNLFLHKVYTALTETDQQAREEERERYAHSVPDGMALITIEVRKGNKLTANRKAVTLLSVDATDGRTLLLEAEACAHQILQALSNPPSQV